MIATVLLGPPGAGKGTVAEVLVDKGYRHVSTGELLREQIRLQTPLGIQAQARMEKGLFVPDDVVVGMIRELIQSLEASARFLFDGFPRTLAQAEMLDQMLKDVDGRLERVLLLDCPDEVIIERLVGRRTCGKCGAVYHVVFNPPEHGNVCDMEGCELSQRTDDTTETVQKRLAVYERQTEPLIAYYQQRDLVVRIDANQSIEAVRADAMKVLG